MKSIAGKTSELFSKQPNFRYVSAIQRFHLDGPLLALLSILIVYGLCILASATNASQDMMLKQVMRLLLAGLGMFVFAQIPPNTFRIWGPWLYLVGTVLLVFVLILGEIGKGAQRWLDLGIIRFQPSEILKLTLPMMVAFYFDHKPLPPKLRYLFVASIMIIVPVLLTAKQPDLGTALMILMSGGCVVLFAGISWRLLLTLFVIGASLCPVLWHFMHDYQQQRVLTFLNPENDPLGTGYHIIQSKIAIGSGGVFGKGWFNGTQSHLSFLPEHATDFIFAVCGEEFGLIGCVFLLALYVAITGRALYIAAQAQDTFSRLLSSALALSFFMSAFVNVGMVTVVLPVVGVPLPLVSYGGTSMVTLMVGFGILMSIHTHRKLWAK